jgi:hypothetical protein
MHARAAPHPPFGHLLPVNGTCCAILPPSKSFQFRFRNVLQANPRRSKNKCERRNYATGPVNGEKGMRRRCGQPSSPREWRGYRIWKCPPPRHPGQGREAPAEPGSIGRRIVRNGPVLTSARFITCCASPEPGRAAQWVPDSLRFAAASGKTGEVPRHMRLPRREWGEGIAGVAANPLPPVHGEKVPAGG